MAALTVEKLLKRADAAWAVHGQWEAVSSEAFRYGLPQRNGYDTESEGAKKGSEVFDSTAPTSARRFTNKMVNLLFPPYRTWAKLEAGPFVAKDDRDDLNEQLQVAQAIMFAVIHNMSAFQTMIGEFSLDLCVGTGVGLVQKGTVDEPIIYEAIPEREVALENGPRGRVGAKFRRGMIAAQNIESTWPDATLPEVVLQALKDKPSTEFAYLEATYTDRDGIIYYEIVLSKTKHKLVSRVLARDPWVVARFMRAAGETRGRGVLIDALADIKTANKLVELILKNATLSVTPIYTAVNDGVVNVDVIQLVPGEFIMVGRNAGNPAGASLMPLERPGGFDVGQIELERLQTNIRATMLDDELPPVTGQPRTATEILERIKRLVEDLGATYGRIVTELLVPLVQLSLDILHEWGLIKLPIRVDGNVVKLTVTSPLAALQNIEDIENVVRAVEMSNALFGPKLTALAAKVEEIPGWIFRKMGVPEELLRDEGERGALEDAVAQILASMEQEQPGAGLQTLSGATGPAPTQGQPRAAA